MISPELIRGYPFFVRHTDRCLKALAMLADERSYQAGVTIFEAGQPASVFYFLIEGRVELRYRARYLADPQLSQTFLVGQVKPGEPFGISALIEPHCYLATAYVSDPSCALALGGVGLRTLFAVDADLSAVFMHGIAIVTMSRLHNIWVQM